MPEAGGTESGRVPNCEQDFVSSSRLKWCGDAGLSAGPRQESDTTTRHSHATTPTWRSSNYRGNMPIEFKANCSTGRRSKFSVS